MKTNKKRVSKTTHEKKSLSKEKKQDSLNRSMIFSKVSWPLYKDSLGAAIKYLQHNLCKKHPMHGNRHCLYETEYCLNPPPNQVKYAYLSARNEKYVLHQIRKAILLHDWNSATRLLWLVARRGRPRQVPASVRATVVTMLNHPSCTREMLKNMTANITGYVTDTKISNFLSELHKCDDSFETWPDL